MKCPKCGATLEYGRICDKCGCVITSDMIRQRKEHINAKKSGSTRDNRPDRGNNQNDKSPIGIIILVVVIVLAIATAVVVGIIMHKNNSGSDSNKAVSSRVENINNNRQQPQNNARATVSQQAHEVAGDSEAKKAMDQAVESANKLLGEKPYDESIKASLEKAISDAKKAKNDSDYKKSTDTLSSVSKEYEKSVRQCKQVTAPEEAFLIARAKTVDTITAVEAATEDTDVNNQLGKTGGYYAYIAMKSSLVTDSYTANKGAVEAGTDGGAVIEAFKSEEDAKKREQYLSAFDGAGAFVSGSHKVVGTLLIRTSHKLKASQQKDLEQKVIDALIRLDE